MHDRVGAREGQGDGVAQTGLKGGREAFSLSFSPSIYRKRNQSSGSDGGDGGGDEKRESVYSGIRKGAFII